MNIYRHGDENRLKASEIERLMDEAQRTYERRARDFYYGTTSATNSRYTVTSSSTWYYYTPTTSSY